MLTPASLVGQWREELETKLDIECATTHDALIRRDPERFWKQKRLIASLALARRSEHAARIVGRSFDMVIVDETYHLRDRNSRSYKLVDALNKRFLLLLSATPVQNDLLELYNVLTLLKPGIFKTLKEFRAVHVTPGKPHVAANPERLRELMRGAMVRNTRAVVALKLPRRHAMTVRVDGCAGEREAYQQLAQAARRLASEGVNRLAPQYLLGAAGSSPAAAAAAVRRLLADRHADAGWHALAQRFASIGAGGKEAPWLEIVLRQAAQGHVVHSPGRCRLRRPHGGCARPLCRSARSEAPGCLLRREPHPAHRRSAPADCGRARAGRALRLRVPAQRHRQPVRIRGREPSLAQGEGH